MILHYPQIDLWPFLITDSSPSWESTVSWHHVNVYILAHLHRLMDRYEKVLTTHERPLRLDIPPFPVEHSGHITRSSSSLMGACYVDISTFLTTSITSQNNIAPSCNDSIPPPFDGHDGQPQRQYLITMHMPNGTNSPTCGSAHYNIFMGQVYGIRTHISHHLWEVFQ